MLYLYVQINSMDVQGAYNYILQRLGRELDSRLTYHSYTHTIDVYDAVGRLADLCQLTPEEKILVETAALYHDAGMLEAYDDHEESSARLTATILPAFGYAANQIIRIQELILATRLPQMARSTLGMILCDADLDYLGREDFFINSFRLKLEWQLYGISSYALSDWFLMQEKFLENHRYLSEPAARLRNDGKHKNLESIRALNRSSINN